MTDTSNENNSVKNEGSNLGFYISITVFLGIFFAVIAAQVIGL